MKTETLNINKQRIEFCYITAGINTAMKSEILSKVVVHRYSEKRMFLRVLQIS